MMSGFRKRLRNQDLDDLILGDPIQDPEGARILETRAELKSEKPVFILPEREPPLLGLLLAGILVLAIITASLVAFSAETRMLSGW